MKIITTKGVTLNVTEFTEVKYIGTKTINRGVFRWILVLLLFWPALLLWFFVGDKVYEFEINGDVYLLDEWNYKRISGV